MADLEQVASDLNSASQSLQELREKYDGALDLLDNKNTEITDVLESAKSNALQEVQTASDTATSQISQLKDTSLNAVNEAKNTATSEISSKKEEALGEFSQATSEFNSTKEEALSQIEQAKAEQGEKITTLEQAKAEQESSITELKESVSTQGQKITEIEENNITQEEKITDLEQAKENIITELSEKSKLLTQKLEWTVGSGGKFENIDDAINEIYKYGKSIYDVTLKIKNGYTITKPTTFYNLPLGVNIVGENGKNDELIIDLNNTAWLQFGLYILMCEVHIHNITIRASSNNYSSIYISTGTNGSIYNVDLIGMSLTNLVIASSGNIEVSNINIQNNYQGAEECYDLSVSNANLQIGANVKFLSNNPEKLVAIRAATNSKISSVWWNTGIDISGNYKVGLQVDGGGVINNPSIAMTGNIGTKFSQTPGQWTTSGYISTNI
ncbi:hypothetical protein [Campylobacter jejuni]|uniref:hypothetical protein n=1 Tax=Campylobacter jejuni TaxID=197 RepID=UPI000873FDBD|nr:hypothetical protein [Campylobacter jejuni]OEW26330.1 hypothetical protein AJ877_08855 [Campylobacter jejuni]